jgi:hypothetical protein
MQRVGRTTLVYLALNDKDAQRTLKLMFLEQSHVTFQSVRKKLLTNAHAQYHLFIQANTN